MNPTGARPRSPPQDHASRRTREDRALKLGLLASALLHILVLALYPAFTEPEGVLFSPGDPSPSDRPPAGTELMVIREVSEPEAPQPEPTEPVPTPPADAPPPQPEATDVAVSPPEVPAPGEDERLAEDGPTVAERLRPQMIDPRLWAPVDPYYTELDEHERAELLLRGMIQSWNDSVAVAEALSDRARDWTYTDDEGRRWGLSPGRLHLGDFSIPLPFAFEIPPGRREEWAERQWIIDDLARGAVNAQIQETWAERARVIRERMEAERRPATAGNNDGGG